MQVCALCDIDDVAISDTDSLETFSNRWFVGQCAWRCPDVKELASLESDALKAQLSKSVISLRQGIDVNNTAVARLLSSRDKLVRAQLDSIALKYAYFPESDSSMIMEKKDKALKNYKAYLKTVDELNANLGARAGVAVCLIADEQEKQKGRNLLSVMNLLKHYEPALQQGLIKCDLLKMTLSFCLELGRDKYRPVIGKFDKDLAAANTALGQGLEKIPSGIAGKQSVKEALVQAKKQLPQQGQDEHTQLVLEFQLLADIYVRVNTVVAKGLADIAVKVEQAHKTLPIEATQ